MLDKKISNTHEIEFFNNSLNRIRSYFIVARHNSININNNGQNTWSKINWRM